MKALISLLLLVSFSASAETVIRITFGKQSNELGFPKAQSKIAAEQLYKKLNLETHEDTKVFTDNHSLIAITSKEARFEMIVPVKANNVKRVVSTSILDENGNRFSRGDVSFSGNAAELLFNILNTEVTVNHVAKVKELITLSCQQSISNKATTECSFKDIAFTLERH